MENVLLAYAKYDTQVGYVQGMNFVVAALLYHCSEEIAFWLFVTLLEDYEIRDVYLTGLPGLYRHTHVIGSLLKRNFKELTEHLSAHEVKIEVFATHWIFTLFSCILPIDEMGGFFDQFFDHSWLFFYRFAIHLIRMVEKEILLVDEMSEIIALLKTFKTIKIGEKLGFFRSLMSGTKIINWQGIISDSNKAVSYTHLTLPTICSV
eukprot:TRINITY_DN4505_c0_g1_i9.p1 TRINITY_DN4505_c0_g1~~TRINITY_DN4505_c0_g1_i9.p1  ORF type:complete len:206 (-),score=46.93 TRINITY_DN4505_c0_g1_i9:42-659(-)